MLRHLLLVALAVGALAPDELPPQWMTSLPRDVASGMGMMAPLLPLPDHLRPRGLSEREASRGDIMPWLVMVIFICAMAPPSVQAWVRYNRVFLEVVGTTYRRRLGWTIPGWQQSGRTATAGIHESLIARKLIEPGDVLATDGDRAYMFSFMVRPLTSISASCDDRIDACSMRLFGSEWAGFLLKTAAILVSKTMLNHAGVIWLPPASTLNNDSLADYSADPTGFEWQVAVGIVCQRRGRIPIIVWLQRVGEVPGHLGRLLRAMAASDEAVKSVESGDAADAMRCMPKLVLHYGQGDVDPDYTQSIGRALEKMVQLEQVARGRQAAPIPGSPGRIFDQIGGVGAGPKGVATGEKGLSLATSILQLILATHGG